MSVVANVAINVDSRNAVSKLREVQQAAQQAQKALEGINGSSTSQPFRNASSSASELIGVLGRLSAAYLGLRTAQQAVQAGIQREESERRLTFLAKGYGEVAKAQELAAQSGKIFGLSATESNQQFSQLYGRLRPLNVSLEDINAAFVGFNTAAKVSGATTAESAGALLQLTQALGSGVLRGQELNSVLEQAPGLVVALTKELGKPVSEIRELAEQGEITSDIVIRALKRAGTEGADELATAMDGPAQAIKNLQNEFENFQVAATEDLLPSIIDGVRILTNSLRAIAPIIKGIGAVAGPVLNYINQLIEGATGARGARILQQQLMQRGAGKLEQAGVGRTYKDAQGNVYSTITGRLVQAASAQNLEGGGGVSGGIGAGGKGRKGKTDAEKAAEKAAREAEKLRKELERSLEVGDQLGTQFSRQAALLFEGSEIERKRLQIQFDFEDRAKQISELKNAEQRTNLTVLNAEIQRLEIIKLQTEELQKQAEEAEKLFKEALGETEFGVAGDGTVAGGLSNAIAKLKEDLDPIKLQVDAIVNGATAIGTAFSTAFGEVITGAKSTQQALADAFKSIGDAFISMAVDIIAKQMTLIILQTIFNALSGGGSALSTANKNLTGTGALKTTIPGFAVGGRAQGGPVANNTPYIVGERGPELFVPNSGGSIVNNRNLRSAMSNGGGSAGGTVLKMNFETTNIGGVEYVSRDQLEAAMASTRRDAARDGAKRGMSMTLDKLQQSPGTRGRVGLR